MGNDWFEHQFVGSSEVTVGWTIDFSPIAILTSVPLTCSNGLRATSTYCISLGLLVLINRSNEKMPRGKKYNATIEMLHGIWHNVTQVQGTVRIYLNVLDMEIDTSPHSFKHFHASIFQVKTRVRTYSEWGSTPDAEEPRWTSRWS